MADSLYFSVWFRDFEEDEMLARALAVMQQFPFSAARPGVTYLAVHPVSWNEATVWEQRFVPGIEPGAAALIASDMVHEDYAYLFEAFWDLWGPGEDGKEWVLQPSVVKFVVNGREFDEGVFEQEGHVEVDFGMDAPFLHEELQLTEENTVHVRANVQKLVEFTAKVEKNSATSARLLWSESEENLAQKLISRLQRVQ